MCVKGLGFCVFDAQPSKIQNHSSFYSMAFNKLVSSSLFHVLPALPGYAATKGNFPVRPCVRLMHLNVFFFINLVYYCISVYNGSKSILHHIMSVCNEIKCFIQNLCFYSLVINLRVWPWLIPNPCALCKVKSKELGIKISQKVLNNR